MEEQRERSQFRHKDWNTWAEDLMEKLWGIPFQPPPVKNESSPQCEEHLSIGAPTQPQRPRARG